MICARCHIKALGVDFFNLNSFTNIETIWLCEDCLNCTYNAGRGLDNEEYATMQELLNMSREELDNVDYKMKKWLCQAKNCTNGTKVRDYGIGPWYYSERKGLGWQNLNKYHWVCGKHNKFLKRLLKNYDKADIYNKLMDNKMPEYRMVELNFERSNKINE